MMMVGKNCVSRTSLYPVTKTTLYYKQMFIFILALLYKEKQQQLVDVLQKQQYVPMKLKFNRSDIARLTVAPVKPRLNFERRIK